MSEYFETLPTLIIYLEAILTMGYKLLNKEHTIIAD